MARPKNNRRQQSLGSSSQRWNGMFAGRLVPAVMPKKVREKIKSHDACELTQHFFGRQFRKHMERVERVFKKLPGTDSLTHDGYKITFSHIYVSLFIEQHCGVTVSDKDFLDAPEIKKRLNNFEALKAVKLRHDPKIIKAIKQVKTIRKKKKKAKK